MTFVPSKVSTRFVLVFSSLLLLMILIIGFAVWRLQAIGSLTEHIVNEVMVKERLITEWHNATQMNGVQTLALIDNENSAERQQQLDGRIKKISKRISELQKSLDAMHKTSEEMALFDDVSAKRKHYITTRDAVFAEKKSAAHGAGQSHVRYGA